MTLSHADRVVRFLVKQPGQEASIAAVHDALSSHESSNPLTAAQIDAAIAKVTTSSRCKKPSDPPRPPPVTRANGKKLVYWGAENYSQPALYAAVELVFTKKWGPKELGLKTGPEHGIVCTGQPPKGGGDWMNPDLVVFAHPRRKVSADAAREIHCFEIEQQNGFGVKSVYQAYEQARGAEYAWVFAHADGIPARVRLVAEELGVGVVTFTNPNAASLYDRPNRKDVAHRAIVAKRRKVEPDDRHAFLERTSLVNAFGCPGHHSPHPTLGRTEPSKRRH
jgi:hypothetical protein